MVKTKISGKGQTTIPREFIKLWQTSRVLWRRNPDGSAQLSPAPDIMSLLGSASDGKPRDPDEKEKGRRAMGRNAAEEGLSQ